MKFELHPRLRADTVSVGRLPLCEVLLSRDASYHWLVLVPAREGITEIHQLEREDRAALMEESSALASTLQRLLDADKMNVASLGNLVPQLHLHVIARFKTDPAWPGTIWGVQPSRAYMGDALGQRLAALRDAFRGIPGFEATAASGEEAAG